ncbi:exo-alpha-sialidase [Spiractinospora alimapuensis]|uniref:sialidase family protein n=1 Tax=Spiractinospora alimapuensis TaxID=2820884 RepID=UPI001F481ADE|nr:sialidase family protein [Spiractinospora alimapuensis]QVQ52218.1 exo-alpha-sialidase [Spiractinospora alimapuensis]
MTVPPRRLAVASAFVVGLSLIHTPAAHADSAGPDPVVVFESGTEGYDTFRIPAITQTDDGTLLAFAEGRTDSGSDHGDIDLVLRRSHDDGRTWGALQVVGDNGPNTFGNPAPVVDPASGDIVLLTTHNAGEATEAEIMRGEVTDAQTRRVHLQRSTDDGETWSEPEDITDDAKLPEWRWYATGPGHGIALEAEPHTGRLVIPANHSTSPDPDTDDTGAEDHHYGSHSLYSDDGGRTWDIGGVDTPMEGVVNPNENTAVELANGDVYFNVRDQNGSSDGARAATISTDGGASFASPFATVPDLVAPPVQGSVLRLNVNANDLVVFSAPGEPDARRRLALRVSSDDAQSWEERVTVFDGPVAYSDLTTTGGQHLGVLFENGDERSYERITYTAVPFGQLRAPAN